MRPETLLATLGLWSGLLGHAIAQRRGGGDGEDGDDNGNGGGDSSPSNDPSEHEFERNEWRPDCDGVSEGWRLFTDCHCSLLMRRMQLFALPGLYYNGTITVTHQVETSTGRDLGVLFADEGLDFWEVNYTWPRCPRDSWEVKTHRYPALFHAGPRGNDSDPNPFHWSLKAFAPAYETVTDGGAYLDINQRLAHIRSSDFYVRRPIRLFDYWAEADANNETSYRDGERNQDTSVFWETDIEETDGQDGTTVYSGSARYVRSPASSLLGDFRNPYAMSQYVTLRDVCMMGYVPDPLGRQKQGWGSELPYPITGAPTLWLPEGTEASFGGLGGNELEFILDSSWEEPIVPRVGRRVAQCGGGSEEQVNQWQFQDELVLPEEGFRVERPDGTSRMLYWGWNMTVSTLRIAFEGTLVTENSTTLDGISGGILRFNEGFDWQAKEAELGYPGYGEESEGPDGSNGGGGGDSGASLTAGSGLGLGAVLAAAGVSGLLLR